MTTACTVPHIDLAIDENDIQKGAAELLSRIRPNWNLADVEYKLLTDGITNKLIKCNVQNDEVNVVLVRIYGRKTDLLIDRTAETRNIILLHKENLAPQLYATFENGLAYEFAPGVTLTKYTVVLPHIFSLVAVKMAKLHLVNCEENSNSEPMIWEKLERFYQLIPDTFTESQIQRRFIKMNISKAKLLKEIKYMREALKKHSSPVVFCHNDLLLGNIVYEASEGSVTFIDYEYAAMNYQAFDIGNHFNEFAGVDKVDYSKYPGKVLQMAWLAEYLRAYRGQRTVPASHLEEMYATVNRYGLLSHLLWGLWALVQAEHSTIDFDFIRFGAARLERYFQTRDEFLYLEPNSEQNCRSKKCQI